MRFRKCSSCASRHNKQQRSSSLFTLRAHHDPANKVHHTNDESSNNPCTPQAQQITTSGNQCPQVRYLDEIIRLCVICRGFILLSQSRSARQCLMIRTDTTLHQDWRTESNCVCMYSVHCRVNVDNRSEFYRSSTSTVDNADFPI